MITRLYRGLSWHQYPADPFPHRTCISGVTGCDYAPSQTFTCTLCQRKVCWCDGGNEDDLCSVCFNHTANTITALSATHGKPHGKTQT